MTISVRWTGPGLPLARAVADEVRRLQGGDPLCLVRVVTADAATNDGLRRALPFAGGVCGAEVQGALRVARDLAAGRIGTRRTAPPVAVLAAVQQVLEGDRCPAALVASRSHPATHDALVQAWQSLSGVFVLGDRAAEAALAQLAGPRESAVAVVDVVRQVRATLVGQGWLDTATLMAAATSALGDAPLPPTLLVVSQQFNPAHVPFLGALAQASSQAAVVAVAFGDERLSTAAHVARLTGAAAPAEPVPVSGPPPVVVSCPDHDEEVREVTRRVIGLLNGGVPADRIAVYYPPSGPHQPALAASLSGAGIPARGHVRPSLRGSVAGQLLRLLVTALTDGVGRQVVVELARTAPFGRYLDDSGIERTAFRAATRWTRQCRQFGVITQEDWDHWAPPDPPPPAVPSQLTLDLGVLTADPADAPAPPDAPGSTPVAAGDPAGQPGPAHPAGGRSVSAMSGDQPASVTSDDVLDRALWGFVRGQIRARDRAIGSTTWAELAARLGAWWRLHAGTVAWRERVWVGYPAWQAEAAVQVEALLEGLAELDDVGLALRPHVAARLLLAALDEDVVTAESKGTGVLVAQVVAAPGSVADHVFVVGANQGFLPGSVTDDLVLTSQHGDEPFGVLTGPRSRPLRDERGVVAALGSAGSSITVTYARHDLRNGGALYPATFLPAGGHQLVASHAASVLDAGDAWLDEAEWFAADPRRAHPGLQRRRRAISARLQRAPGEFDGQVGSLVGTGRANPFVRAGGQDPDELRAIGITALESLGKCGMRYFVERVLGATAEDADAIELADIEPREQGDLLHHVFDSLLREWLERHEGADGQVPWIADGPELAQRVARAGQLVDEGTVELRARRRLGHPEMWAARRAHLLAAITDQLTYEMRTGVRPVASELTFGAPDERPVVWEGAHGAVAFRGSIDRVNRIDGQLEVVDFKSGSRRPYSSITPKQPLGADRGSLQLPLYGWAAEQVRGERVDRALYQFVGKGKPDKPIAVTLDDETRQAFRDRLDELIGQALGGSFEPGEVDEQYPCRVCAPDGMGGDDVNQRRLTWRRP